MLSALADESDRQNFKAEFEQFNVAGAARSVPCAASIEVLPFESVAYRFEFRNSAGKLLITESWRDPLAKKIS